MDDTFPVQSRIAPFFLEGKNFLLILGIFLVLCGCDSGPTPESVPPNISSERVVETMHSVRAYQLAQLPDGRKLRGWSHCAFYAGMMAAYQATGDRVYLDSTRVWAIRNDWTLGANEDHADHQCVGQVYLDLYAETPAARRIDPTRAVMRDRLGDPRPGHEVWDWADALFMAPPVWARLGAATGNDIYFNFMSERFWEASEPLFDPEHGLYYRDERFVDRETAHGAPVFWSRGNGWVLAGIARILQHLPEDHSAHPRFVKRFRTMAAAVAPLQQDDGLWRTSLLDPCEYPAPETSGTALFTYALAWGINEGYLSREDYRATVLKGWGGLSEAVNEEGRLGWVQEVGSRPGPVEMENTGAYGVGGLLMAGSELLRMLE